MRLDRFLCHASGFSRQQVQRAVRDGAVSVNGVLIKKPDTHIAVSDTVTLDGAVMTFPSPRYFMLNKPAGYVCANTDSTHPVVTDLIREKNATSLQIAGRLDIDTTGLVLLTDDGQWNHRITAPSRQCQKTYHVTLSTPLDLSAANQLRKGILLDGEKKPTQPADLSLIDNDPCCITLTISEGKYHQVKRMFAAAGNHVTALHRHSIGNIVLDPALQPGEYRPLTATEIAGST